VGPRVLGEVVSTPPGLTRYAAAIGGAVAASRALQLLLALIVETALFARISPYFVSATNVMTILQNSADLAIVSVGMAVVLTLGGVDISVGSVEGIAAILIGKAIEAHWGVVAAVLGPVAGGALGFVNGLIVAYGRVPAIIATLGTMNTWRAAIFLLIGGRWISGLPDVLGGLISGTGLGMTLIAVYVLVWYVMRLSSLGPHIHAIGNNPTAAAYAGVPVRRATLFAYTFVGAATGLAAVLYVARYQNVEINVGTSTALDAIAAAVLGGTSVMGGELNLLGTAVGVAFVAVLRNGLVLMDLPALWEQVVIGILLVAVLSVDFVRQRIRRRAAT
jgi:AI-2 transport system permease protein